MIDVAKGKHPMGSERSPHWASVRKAFLVDHPSCAVCGGTDHVEVHHQKPFHLHPELELDNKNFVTLCESKKDGVNCHLLFGHLGNFRSFNVDVLKDAKTWFAKIKNRPLHEGD